ncbi:histidine phosphatase family protein [Flavobacterium sp. SUN052]|uniref:SixA phosphatase family protein n=1 Tax=Flavobacterium sp. SUN052 TaxID=3002441 RepID=UPI00237D5C70|nr:histidine phosphatase family protein [Flavobacterium sp. SUN052]MEC4005033.1 histidine phosphatase family protein [Flavobacterium sp. SUN052]
MKNIILVRHAKSSWKFSVDDFDRNITFNGIENSIKVANNSLKLIHNESIIWSSPAKRAYETAKIVIEYWQIDTKSILLNNDLYTFDSIELEKIVKSCTNDYNNLILFGHNSAITDFVNKFGDIFVENVPTSGLVSINFDTDDWNHITKGKINKILFPRDL